MSSLCRTIRREMERNGKQPEFNIPGNRRRKRSVRHSKEYRAKVKETKNDS